jgi:hypothetical protein
VPSTLLHRNRLHHSLSLVASLPIGQQHLQVMILQPDIRYEAGSKASLSTRSEDAM